VLNSKQFAQALVAAGVMSATQVKRLWDELPQAQRSGDPRTFSDVLVRDGLLTEYQAAQALDGRAASLVMGEYLILDRLGAGGMGQVFKAQHRRMERLVALKLIAPIALKDQAAVRRFRREVKAAAKLLHPNIVTAFDAGESAGVKFLVMELVDGCDLSTLVKQHGPLPVKQAVSCTMQAACALAHAHAKGIVHRDIKPANLLLDSEGTVKVLDMGLARLDQTSDDGSDDGLTGTGNIMGTVDYMAPEQALDTRRADARADIYSLGCTLYYLLTGKKMYEAETAMKKLMAHQQQPIPPLVAARDEVPAALDEVFRKMVTKRPDDRYQSADELLAALRAVAPQAEASLGETSQFTLDSRSGSQSPTLKAFLAGLDRTAAVAAVPTVAADTDRQRQTAQSLIVDAMPGSASRRRVTSRGASNRTRPRKAIVVGASGAIVAIALGAWALRSQSAAPAKIVKKVIPASATLRQPPPLARAPFNARAAREYQRAWAAFLGTPVETRNSLGAKMIVIPPGEFQMGSSGDDIKRAAEESDDPPVAMQVLRDELPKHWVRISRPFLVGENETTVGQFAQFIRETNFVTLAEKNGKAIGWNEKDTDAEDAAGSAGFNWRNVGFPLSDDHPATCVEWEDAVEFCNWLSAREKRPAAYRKDLQLGWQLLANDGYRLLTEAEWEYACRAGTETSRFWGDRKEDRDIYVWHHGSYQTHPVGQKMSNAFGLNDMLSNAGEWCHDYYAANYAVHAAGAVDPTSTAPTSSKSHVRRGANAAFYHIRSAHREGYSHGKYNVGFRVVRTVTLPPDVAPLPPPVWQADTK
jgi:serine/threonine-protein kinase